MVEEVKNKDVKKDLDQISKHRAELTKLAKMEQIDKQMLKK